MKEIKIRDAVPDELVIIRAQRIDAYQEHSNKIPKEHWKALKKALSSEVDQLPGAELIVAELESSIVGSVVLFPAKTDAYEGYVEELEYPEIRMLAVSPNARGKGIASALIAECIKRTREKGYTSIGLHTGDFMDSAMRLYERLGFRRLPQFDFEPADDGILVKAYTLHL